MRVGEDLGAMLRKVRGIVHRAGVATQDVDDLIQEAFARVESYARKHEVRSREALLVTTATNLSRDQARRRIRSPMHDDRVDLERLVDDAPQPEERLLMLERLRRIDSGMRRLDEQTRRCVLAKRLEGLTAAAIAERENLSIAAVEKRVARALLFLAQWMGET